MIALTKPLHNFLHRFDPETAHEMVIKLLKVYQTILPKVDSENRIVGDIKFSAAPSLRFQNRIGLAAGFDKNAEVFPALASLGFGFLEVGTVTPLPQKGNPKPRIFRVKGDLLVNALGFNNCGLEKFQENLERLRPFVSVPIFTNIGKGRDTALEKAPEDYKKGFDALKSVTDGFIINISSPNTPGLFTLQTREFLETIEKVAPKDIPIFVKLSPDLENRHVEEMCDLVTKSGRFCGLVLTNTSRIFADKRGFSQGGLSGPQLLSRSTEVVKLARKKIGSSKIIIGVGGVSSVDDMKTMRKAGADLVEVYTSFVYQGPSLISELSKNIE